MDPIALIMAIMAALCAHQAWAWRKRALYFEKLVNSVQNNLKPAKDMINALSDERRMINTAMTDAFDWINNNGDRENSGLMQCKNILLHALQNSTYREGEHGTGS